MREFRLEWDESKVEALCAAVRRYRFPNVAGEHGWTRGCDPVFLKSLCDY